MSEIVANVSTDWRPPARPSASVKPVSIPAQGRGLQVEVTPAVISMSAGSNEGSTLVLSASTQKCPLPFAYGRRPNVAAT